MHFLLLAEQHTRFGVIAGEEDEVGIGGLQLGEDGGVVALARGQGVVEHHRHARVLEALLRFFGEALGVGGVVVQDGDLLEALGGNDLAGHAALFVIAGAGAEEKGKALFRQAHAGGPRGDLHDFGFVDDVLGSLGHGGTVRPDDRHHPGGGQLLGGEGGRARITRVVFHNQLDLLAVDAARLVHFRNEQAHDLLHVLAFAGPLAGKRAHQADADSVRGKGGTGRQHEHGGDKHQFFHKFVHAFP